VPSAPVPFGSLRIVGFASRWPGKRQTLDALADALEDGIATFKDPYRVSSEQFRRAVDALLECIEAL